jgi:hypothetical protein
MTISIKVKVWDGANWAAEVVALDYPPYPHVGDEPRVGAIALVYPGGEYEACGTDTRQIRVREISLDKARMLENRTAVPVFLKPA